MQKVGGGPQLYCDFFMDKLKRRWYFNFTFMHIFM